MKWLSIRTLSALVALLGVAGIGWYLWFERESLRTVVDLDVPFVVLTVLSLGLYLVLTGEVLRESLRLAGETVERSRAQALSLVGNGLNQIGNFLLGHGARAAYLKRVRDIPYFKYLAALVAAQVAAAFSTSVIAAVSFFLLATISGSDPIRAYTLAAVSAGLATTFFLVTVSAGPFAKVVARYAPDRLAKGVQGFAEIARGSHRLLPLAMISLMQCLSHQVAIWLAGRAASLPNEIIPTIAVTSFGSLASLVSITPGGIGVFELAMGMVATATGLTASHQVAGVMAFRAIFILESLLGAAVGLLVLSRKSAT